jgi:hypothetical protein
MAVCLVDVSRPRDGASSENMVFEFCSENFLPPCFRSNRFEGGLHNWVFVRMRANFTAFYKIRRHSQKYLSSIHSFGTSVIPNIAVCGAITKAGTPGPCRVGNCRVSM